ncbi:MAG: putative mRNA 3-end processing factor, partial [Cyanobacteriota bacterium erpe_2018_sw_39hr_WHONDRS-SW48-000098_B_bin.30]|nr:putative mRNA 3-end processing factor [Cyanobacteriota bacterium erpe_2018_sw_39hr_WHONDRS-SW48-000098_B_bin.30]
MSDLVTVTESGLYCAMGDFYIDPWRSVKLALVTHGHSDHARVGSQRYITHKDGQAILRYRLGEIDVTGVDYGQVLQLGGVKVSFHPAGHVLGSAQIRIETDKGEVWVVSGDYKAQYDPTCPGIEPVRCD